MQAGDQLIQLFDQQGMSCGVKPRQEVDRTNDILHCVKVTVRTSDQKYVLAAIPDHVPAKNIFIGLLSSTSATMLRAQEAPKDAAYRAVEREVGIEPMNMRFVANGTYTVPAKGTSITRLYTLFLCESNGPFDKYSHEDIERLEFMTAEEIKKRLQTSPLDFDPAFVLLWQRHEDQLLSS